MKLKTLMMLIVLAIILAGWAAWTIHKQTTTQPSLVGARVLPPFPINDVNKIKILSSGTNITVAKIQGIWKVTSRFNYPAKFDKVVEVLQELSELKIGQAIPATKSQMGQFALLPPATNVAAELAGKTGTRLQLSNDKNQVLATLLIGKPFMRQPPTGQPANPMLGIGGYPDGQYIRTGEDKVFLVAKTLSRLTEDAKSWLDDEFINVSANDILEMTVTGPERDAIILRRAKAGDALTLEDARAGEGTVDSAKVNQLTGGLHYLGFDDVAAPTLTAEKTGLDRAIVVKARTIKGRRYTLRIGNTLNNDTFDRYMQVSVTYAPPATEKTAPDDKTKNRDETKALAGRTQALNAKLSPWIFVLKSYRAGPLLMKREELIKKPE